MLSSQVALEWLQARRRGKEKLYFCNSGMTYEFICEIKKFTKLIPQFQQLFNLIPPTNEQYLIMGFWGFGVLGFWCLSILSKKYVV